MIMGMSDEQADRDGRTGREVEQPQEPETRGPNWRLRALVVLAAIPTVVILYAVAASFFPRWWAHHVGSQSRSTFHLGITWGLAYGFVCTLLSLIVLRQAVRKRFTWNIKGILVLVAAALSIPNLLTLGIVWGSGSAAHAGQRTLDSQAPGFRGATLIGVVLAAVVGGAAQYLWSSRKRNRRQLKELKARVREQEDRPGTQDRPDTQDQPDA
jgi:hypothetical protein